MKRDEGYVEVPGGRVWYASAGDGGGAPLLLLHGGPGFPSDAFEPLEELGRERRVIRYDQLGCGRSDRPGDESLWRVPRFVEELEAVRRALGLDRFHLWGISWGSALAMQYTLDRRPPLASLTLASMPSSTQRWLDGCAELLAGLPPAVQETIASHERRGFTGCPEYTAAALEFDKRHGCRLDPWPDALERCIAGSGGDVYRTMWGPSEFTCTGNLRDWDVTDRLGDIRVPTLVTGGRHDACLPRYLEELAGRIAGAELVIFEESAHNAYLEEPERYRDVLSAFLRRAEGGG